MRRTALLIALLAVGLPADAGRNRVPVDPTGLAAATEGSWFPNVSYHLGNDTAWVADLPGTVVVVFWATWSSSSTAQLRELGAIAARPDVTVIALPIDDGDAVLRYFDKPAYLVASPTAQTLDDFRRTGHSLPATWIIDPEGRVASASFGYPRDPGDPPTWLKDKVDEAVTAYTRRSERRERREQQQAVETAPSKRNR